MVGADLISGNGCEGAKDIVDLGHLTFEALSQWSRRENVDSLVNVYLCSRSALRSRVKRGGFVIVSVTRFIEVVTVGGCSVFE
jgi:hypothetical protein